MAENNLPRGLSPVAPTGPAAPRGLTPVPSGSVMPRGLSPRTTPEAEDKQWYDDTFLGEVGEGVVSGVIGIGEGVLGLGTTAVDLIAGTEYTDTVTGGAEYLRDSLGLDPEGFAGKGAEIVTQFVVPGLAAARAVNVAAKAARAARGVTTPMSRAERFGLAAKEFAAAGAVDAVVSNDGMTTIGDWVGFSPTESIDLIGLTGREKALARLSNRFKIGVESALLGGVAQAALTAGGRALGQTRVVRNVARAARDAIDNTGAWGNDLMYKRMLADPAQELTSAQKGVADAIAFARYGGYLPRNIATKRLIMDGRTQVQLKAAERVVKDFDKGVEDFLKNAPEGGVLDRVGILNKAEAFLTEKDAAVKAQLLKDLPKPVRQSALRMRAHIDKLSEDVLNSNFLRDNKFLTKDGKNVDDIILENINSYLRRRYRIFEDVSYTPTDDSIRAAEDYFTANRSAAEKELTELARKDTLGKITDEFLQKNGLQRVGAGDSVEIKVGAKVTPEVARTARENFLNRYSIKNREKLKGGFIARDRLETGMFLSREEIPKTLRALLGEIDDPREAYLGTVADLAQFTGIDDYYGTIKKLAENDTSIGRLFVDGQALSDAQKTGLRERGFVQLGGDAGESSIVGVVGKELDDVDRSVGRTGWGSLDGYFVPKSIYNDLTRYVAAEDNVGVQALRGLWSTFLRGKALSQYNKTVLSPITQIRNATTAVAFALANGNIPVFGRGSNMDDAFKAVFANITNRGSDEIFDALSDAQRRGVMGTNPELREIQDLLRRGAGMSARETESGFAQVVGKRIGERVEKITKPAEAIYQGSDDFWKFFNYNAEQAHLRHALRDAPIEQQVAYLTRNMQDVSPEMATKLRQIKSADEYTPEMLDDLIKDRAAQIVRDTVPNYNKAASDLVSLARKLPLGNFITFPAEMYRTSFNIMKQSLDDMASDIPAIQARGRQRLMGIIGTAVIMPAAAAEMGYALSGVGREEMDAYKRSFGARWEKGAVLVPIGRTEDGKIQYINCSMSNPYEVIGRAANRLVNEADDAIRQGKTPSQVVNEVGLASVREFLEPFLSEAMLTEAMLDVTIRGGRTATGAEVYNPQETGLIQFGKGLTHVLDTLVPGVSPVDLTGEPGRFIRGTIGNIAPGLVDPEDKLGRERDMATELVRAFAGVTPLEFDPKKGLEFSASRLQRARTDSRRIFNSVTNDYNATPQDLMDAYVASNEAKLRNDREFFQIFEDLQTMGLGRREIAGILRDRNVGSVREIINGEFIPFQLSRRNIETMNEVGIADRLPREAIRQYQQQLRGVSLIPDTGDRGRTQMPDAPQAEAPAPRPSVPAPSPSMPRGLSPMPRGLTPVLPQGLSPIRAPVNPALLGDNPADQAANAAIAARTGQA